jgi:hypothetical protein
MGKVLGALIGPIAVAAYALAAAELLRGETGVELLGALKAQLPEDVLAWIARSPLASGEGAPAWRTVVVGLAVGAGAAGGLLLTVGARTSAVLLWLAFLLFLGVLVGQDLVLAGALPDFDIERLVPIGGVLGASFLLALIANFATAGRRDNPGDDGGDYDRAARMRERLRSDPPVGRTEPTPRGEEWPEPKRRAARSEPPPPEREAAAEPPEPPAPDDPPREREALRDEPPDRREPDAPDDDRRDHAPSEAEERVTEKT